MITFTESELKKFLSTRRILIADSGVSTARSLRRFLMQYGAQSELITICETFENAKIELLASPVSIFICDLVLGDQDGLELVRIHESTFPSRLEIASIVMSGDPSQTSIGLITESNIDSLLIKPVTQKNFQDALFQALANKIKPTEYHRALEKGKEHLNQDDLDQALAHFEKAQALDPRAALPFYYLGQGQEKKGNLQNAVQKYQGGLKINPIDYRCLIGLLDLHLSAKEFELAYEVAKRIHQTYPVSSTRFLGLVNLSIQVKKFTDVLDYYEAFKQIQKREPRMNRVIVAGMLVCAKYFLICNEIEKCRSVLSDAIKVAQETGEILPEVLRYCIETKNYELALDLYGKLPDDLLKTFEVQFLYIQIKYEQGDMESVVSFGTPLLQHAEVSLSLYELLIEASRLVGRNEKSIAALVDDAEARFPAARESLQKLMI